MYSQYPRKAGAGVSFFACDLTDYVNKLREPDLLIFGAKLDLCYRFISPEGIYVDLKILSFIRETIARFADLPH